MNDRDPERESSVGHDPLAAALERAERWLEADRPERAERELAAALAIDPKHVLTHILLARCAIARSQWDRADEHARTAVALDPDAPHTIGLLAAIAVERGRFSEAEERILEALRLDPTSAWLYEIYGDIMRVTGHLEKARKLYERGLSFSADRGSLHSKLSIVAALEDKSARARIHARAGLAEDAEGVLAHGANGAAWLASGRPFAARRAFREALRLDPTHPGIEEGWRESDRCSRVVYLPMYYWSLVTRRIPGQQFTVWALFIAFTLVAPRFGISPTAVRNASFVYLGFVIYTWIATPLVNFWIKLRPAR